MIATFPSRKYEIDEYPAIKKHLLSYGFERLEQTGKTYIINGQKVKARKKTSNKWFETQDSIKYWNEFFKQKVVYREISDAMNACMVDSGYMLNNKCYLITGEHLIYLLSFLNSKLFAKIVLPQVNITGGKGEAFLTKISLIIPSSNIEEEFVRLYDYREYDSAASDIAIDSLFCSLYNLTPEEREYILK